MIEGHVSSSLEPIIEIGLSLGDRTTAAEAIVDTGFGGWVCLSERHLEQIDLTFKFVERYELANGEVIVKDVYRGTIEFDQVPCEVDVITTSSADALVGASLLQDRRLMIDYSAGTVRIQ